MNRRKRTIAVVLISTVMASLAAFGMYRVVRSIPVREVEVASYHVVVATKPLAMGTRLNAGDLKVVAWPSSSPVANSHADTTDTTKVVNRGLIASVLENEPITESKMAPLEAGAGLSPSIPPGMRAMSVKVDEVVGVAGFVVPGTKVDVLVTLRRGQDDSMTRTVVSNLQVLTAGTRYDQDKLKDGEPIPSTVVTLMVSPTDAEKITLAQSEGKIMLALRNPLDTEQTDTPGVRSAGLLGQAAPPPVVRKITAKPVVVAPPVAPSSTFYTVEAIRAAKRTEEVVR
jgi:pilus assembly protein CpaB